MKTTDAEDKKILLERGGYELQEGCCNTCRFWLVPDQEYRNRNGKLAPEPLPIDYYSDGHCRRYPPTIHDPKSGMQANHWPATMMHDWCGEWVARDKTKKESIDEYQDD